MDEAPPHASRWNDGVEELMIDDEGDDPFWDGSLVEYGVNPDEIS
jgi:hypothetical protein